MVSFFWQSIDVIIGSKLLAQSRPALAPDASTARFARVEMFAIIAQLIKESALRDLQHDVVSHLLTELFCQP
jgi:hypothetical protein